MTCTARRRALGAAATLLALPAAAQDRAPPLAFPVDCTLGRDCYVQNYVDRDPGPGRSDFACGPLSYDGHQGTDVALLDLDVMEAGVDVLAAAPGVVRGTRDVWPDVSIRDPAAPNLDGQDCGNGVLIDHGGGWQTQYCHLRRGSVAVRAGERVRTGTVLGEVGLSGRTEFPHLHLTVRKDGEVVDPYDADADPACGPGRSLWRDTPAYVATGVLAAGLLPRMPSFDELKAQPPKTVPWTASDGDALVAWMTAFGGRDGDEVRFVIEGPEGRFHEDTMSIDGDRAIFFRAAGRRAPEGGWPPGRYATRIEMVRGGEVIERLERSVTLR